MQLQTLLRDIESARVVQGDDDEAIEAIAYDSRRVERGTLFVAVPGFETDGHRFLPEALERGAAACTAGLVTLLDTVAQVVARRMGS